jgi:uncharacterized membrane protein
MTHEHNSFIAKLRNDFIAGIAVLLPAVGTIWIVQFIVIKVNQALLDPVLDLIAPLVPWADTVLLTSAVKIIIFTLILVLIAVLGLLIKNFFIRQVLKLGETIVMKVPFVNKIYSAIQQISGSFLLRKKEMFSKVVLVEFPRKGVFMLALITAECEGVITQYLPPHCINVFVPTTPNPTSGFLIMVPADQVVEIPMSVEDAMKMIISGGVVIGKETAFKFKVPQKKTEP